MASRLNRLVGAQLATRPALWDYLAPRLEEARGKGFFGA